ncbi:MAG: aldolase/citrate lyase family protein [Planctomycetota bacterium]|nr:aldolase/citrate lyase family protein [Planctomycetota bacterium]
MDEVRTGFKSRLAAGELLLGSMVTLPSPAVAEILVELGYQWLFVDGEHGPLETAEVLAILQAVGKQVPCIVRVPAVAEVPIKKMLDLGAAGIIAPQVNTAQQAADVVAWSRYAPEGRRGVGLARAHGYGLNFQEYVESANQEITVIVQAEHAEAVENIEQIVQVEGIDAVLLGPYDLAASLGKMGQVDDPEVTGAIDRITAACQDAGLPLGIFGVSADAIRPYVARGYNLVVAGTDTIFLASAGGQMLGELQ